MRYLYALIAVGFVFAANAQDKKPQYHKFVEGSYYTTHETKSGDIDTVIIRRENHEQKEYRLKNGEEKLAVDLKVIWKSEKVYILRSKKQISNSSKPISGDIICKIIETGENYYKVKAWSKDRKKMELTLYTYQAD